MELEYMRVEVDGMGRRFPKSHIKIRYKPSDENTSISVFVFYPSYTIEGYITREAMNELLEYGERTGIKVVSAQYEQDEMVDYIQDIKYGKPKDTDDEVTKAMRRKYGRTLE
jgi:hypothetical protein